MTFDSPTTPMTSGSGHMATHPHLYTSSSPNDVSPLQQGIPGRSIGLKAVLLVGGPSVGTRFRPLSLTMPKPLFPIAGVPMIYHHIAALAKVEGMREILLIGFYDNGVFDRFLSEVQLDFPHLNIRYLREYVSLGTGGGIYHFRDEILRGNPEYFFVIHADIASSFPLTSMLEFHRSHGKSASILGTQVPKDIATRYGSIVAEPNSKEVLHYVEKPETYVSDIISCGIYVFSKDIIRDMGRAVAERRAQYEKQVEEDPYFYSATPSDIDVVMLEQDVLRKLAGNHRLYVMLQGPDDFWMQIKAAASALPANALYLQHWKKVAPHRLAKQQSISQFPNAHFVGNVQAPAPSPYGTLSSRLGMGPSKAEMEADIEKLSLHPQKSTSSITETPTTPKNRDGPELIQPVIIHPSAVVHPTAKIGPNVSVAARAVIGRGVRVKDSIILDAVEIKHDSIVLNSIIGRDCRIGCWSRVEGSPVDIYGAADTGGATINGIKEPGATVLGRDVKVADEVVVRNCIVLPNKELKGSFHNEILM